jgi:hypothetical protein
MRGKLAGGGSAYGMISPSKEFSDLSKKILTKLGK